MYFFSEPTTIFSEHITPSGELLCSHMYITTIKVSSGKTTMIFTVRYNAKLISTKLSPS